MAKAAKRLLSEEWRLFLDTTVSAVEGKTELFHGEKLGLKKSLAEIEINYKDFLKLFVEKSFP